MCRYAPHPGAAGSGPSTPYAGAARTAARKIAASTPGPASAAARELAARIVALPAPTDSTVRTAVEQALTKGTVLRLSCVDATGRRSDRAVEPAGPLTADGRWYLIAWCRTRQAGFRLDRITAATPTAEPAQPHDLTELLGGSAAADAVRPSTLPHSAVREAGRVRVARRPGPPSRRHTSADVTPCGASWPSRSARWVAAVVGFGKSAPAMPRRSTSFSTTEFSAAERSGSRGSS